MRTPFEHVADEVRWLGESARTHALEHQKTTNPSESDSALVAVKSYAQAEAKDFLHATAVLPEHEVERLTLNLKPEEHDRAIEALFEAALTHGIKNALDAAARLKNPHLEDDFHRFLAQYLHTIGAIPGLKKTSTLEKDLGHRLFAVSLPSRAATEGDQKKFAHFLGAMEQFYLSMQSIPEAAHYTLELAVEHTGRDILMYASIPQESIELFQRAVHAYYPGATIEEASDDYNIFNPAGAVAGSVATLERAPIFPLASGKNFEHDPLASLVSSLASLEHEGEGAAIQLTIACDHGAHNKLFGKVISEAEKKPGETVEKLYEHLTESFLSSAGRELFSFLGGEKHEPEAPKDQKEKTLDQHGIELAKEKNETSVVRVGLRVLASAASSERAEVLRTHIEASCNQFARVGSNQLVWKPLPQRKIFDLCHLFSFRTRDADHELILSVRELATLFHFPTGITAAPELKASAAGSAPAPASMDPRGVHLGENNYQGKITPVYLGAEDRMRHCYVIGQTGTGKTTLLKHMVIQDIRAGRGACVIDPHGNDLEDILGNIPPERADDIIYFDPAYTPRPMGLNMLEYDPAFPEQKTLVVNELLAIFNKLFDMKIAGGPAFEQYFRNAALLVMEDPASGSTLLEISRVLANKEFRDLKLSRCSSPIIKQFWENAERASGEQQLANFVPYITNKFDVFISNDIMRPVVAQEKSVFNFREIMDTKKVLLVNLSKGRLGDINAHLIGLVLVGKILMAALSRVDKIGRESLPDFHLYIDEFQNVTTDSISVILSEARKYRLGLTVAHQYIEQLEEGIKNAVFGNVGSMVVYRVSPENATVFEKQLAPTFSAADILKLQNFHAYAKVLVGGVPEKPFNLKVPPVAKGNQEFADKLKELSYLRWGRPREEVEQEIIKRYQ